MRRIFIFIIILLLLSFLPSVLPAATESASLTTLPSGLKVIVSEGHAVNLVAVDVWVKAGSVHETAGNNGITHMIEHMVFKATSKYGPGQIDREMEGVGAELNGGTSKDWVHFYTTVESQYLPTALSVIADAVMNAKFRPEDLEKERTVVLDEIARVTSDPVPVATAGFFRSAYTNHPYALPAAGTKDSISRLNSSDLAAFYEKYFTPRNMTVVVTGDVAKAQALSEVEKAFVGFDKLRKSPVSDTPIPAEPARTKPITQRFFWQSSQSCLVLGFPVAAASDFKDVCALDAMLALLGDTYSGRVSTALRNEGIRFSKVVTDFVIQKYPSYFYVLVLLEPQDRDKAIPILLTEFKKLTSQEVPPAELSRAKSRVQGSDLYLQETFSGQARALGLYDAISSYDNALTYGAIVGSLTASDITSVATKYFSAQNYCLLTIDPKPASAATGKEAQK